jgi:hypothetical protein
VANRAKVEEIREPGLKVRIVTKSEGPTLVLGHTARRRLFQGLRQERAVKDVLAGDEERALDSLIGVVGDVLSSDLSRASDLLPEDLIRALVDGLVASERFDQFEVAGLQACTGAMKLEYHDGTTLVSTGGILMGLPTTWSLLCLVHLWWMDEARREIPLPRFSGGRPPLFRSLICGDDALIVANSKCLDRYEEVLRASGGIISPGKHFRSSSGRGVFLEKLLCMKGEKVSRANSSHWGLDPNGLYSKIVAVTIGGSITLRGLVQPTFGLHIGAKRTVATDLQASLAAGAVVESLVSTGSNPRSVHAVQMTLHRSAIDELRKHGIPPLLPRTLGGGGFITRNGFKARLKPLASRSHRKAIAVLLSGNARELGPGIFSRMWNRSTNPVNSMAEEDAETLLARVPHEFGEVQPGPSANGAPWYDCGPLDDFLESATSEARSTLALQMGNDILPRQASGPAELGRRLRATRTKLLSKWPGVSPLKKGTVGELVARQQLLAETTRVWLPGTEDPADKLAPFGMPMLAGRKVQVRLRAVSRRAMGIPP